MKQRGFTLTETLIAVTIMAAMGALTYGTFSRAMDARERAQEITDHYHEVRQAMLRMAREISQAFLSVHKDCQEPRTATIFQGKRDSNGMRLDFTSFSHFKYRADANESDQNELSYFVANDPNNANVSSLMRREQKRIDEHPTEGGDTQVMAENVKSLTFEFYDPKADRWEEEWDSGAVDYKNRLPKFVTIKMKTKVGLKKEEEFVVKTRVFLREAISIPGAGFTPCVE